MLGRLVAFEWRLQARRPAFAACSLLFLALGFALTATGFGPDNLRLGAPYLVAESAGFLSLFSVFAAAAFGSNAVARDAEHRFEEIVFSTPVRAPHLLLGRFAGSALAALAAVAFAHVGLLLGALAPWQDPARAAPPDLGAHLWAFAAITAPNALFASLSLFALAAWARSTLATYAGAAFAYALYFVSAALTDSPLMAGSTPGAGGGFWPALLDPFGLAAFFEDTRLWTTADKDARRLALSGALLLNRLAWAGFALALGALLCRTFSLRPLGGPKAPPRPRAGERDAPTPRPAYRAVAPAERATWHWLAAYASASRLEAGALAGRAPVRLMLGLWALVAGAEIYSAVFGAEYGSALYPTTAVIVDALRMPLSAMGTVLLAYCGAETFWRERRFRTKPVLDATPAPGSALIAAKLTALAALAACLVAVGALLGVALQFASGYWRIEPLVYLSLCYFAGLPLLLQAAASAFLHAISPGRHAGLAATLLFALASRFAPALGLEHPLWRFAGAPPWHYADMSGFDHGGSAFHWLMLHWGVVALLLVTLAAGAFRGDSARDRLRRLLSCRSPHAAALAACAALTGGWVFYNTNVRSTYTTARERLDWRADYERAYRPAASLPRPRAIALEASVDLYPAERGYRVSGRYELVNESPAPIETVLVAVRREASGVELSMPGARLASADGRFGVYRFEFGAPLAPGAKAELRFALGFADRGLSGEGSPVAENGSFIMGHQCFPTFGYRQSYEILDPIERRRRGLAAPSRPAPDASSDAHDLDADGSKPEWVDFAITVSTSGDQVALAPGRLERAWQGDGRRHFLYRSSAPAPNRLVLASARYAREGRRHGDVDLEVYHHPGHGANVGRMLDAAAFALDEFEREFGPYPERQLRIVEAPSRLPFGGYATPGMIFVGEGRGFLTDARDARRPDLVTRRVAHEVAHQWWGHRVAAAEAEGASVIVESLAKYSEALVIERMLGGGQARRQLEAELDRYLSGRSRERGAEVPLYLAGDQPYLYYGKGALAMHAVRDAVGEGALNAALRRLAERHGAKGAGATTLDLIEELRRIVPEGERDRVEELMRDVVLYDLGLESAVARRRGDGRYDVKVRVTAEKARADARGRETPLAFDEPVEIALFGASPDDGPGAAFYRRKHALRPGMNEIDLVVDEAPARAAVDPWLTRIDKNRSNNWKGLRVEGARLA